jgi:hypothetical protein
MNIPMDGYDKGLTEEIKVNNNRVDVMILQMNLKRKPLD